MISDPPDPNYEHVAPPRVSDSRLMSKVRRGLPDFGAWVHREDVLDATLAAMTTALNRAHSAIAANALSALTRQEAAVALYAQRAGALMRSEAPIANAAGRQLRRLRGSGAAHAVALRLADLVTDPRLLAARAEFGTALATVGSD